MHAFSPTFCKGPFLCTFVRFLLIFYPLLRAFSPTFVTVCFYAIYCGRSIYLKTKINWSLGQVVKGPSQMIGCVSTEIKKFFLVEMDYGVCGPLQILQQIVSV